MEVQFFITVLNHYFKSVFAAAGLEWTEDNSEEVDGAVKALNNAMVRDASNLATEKAYSKVLTAIKEKRDPEPVETVKTSSGGE